MGRVAEAARIKRPKMVKENRLKFFRRVEDLGKKNPKMKRLKIVGEVSGVKFLR